MRIHIGIAMAGKVFGTGNDAAFLQTMHVGDTEACNFCFVFTK